jgi:hypothetical protein
MQSIQEITLDVESSVARAVQCIQSFYEKKEALPTRKRRSTFERKEFQPAKFMRIAYHGTSNVLLELARGGREGIDADIYDASNILLELATNGEKPTQEKRTRVLWNLYGVGDTIVLAKPFELGRTVYEKMKDRIRCVVKGVNQLQVFVRKSEHDTWTCIPKIMSLFSVCVALYGQHFGLLYASSLWRLEHVPDSLWDKQKKLTSEIRKSQ